MNLWNGVFVKSAGADAIKQHLSVYSLDKLSTEEYDELFSDGIDRTEIVGGESPFLLKVAFDSKPPYYQYIIWLDGGGTEGALNEQALDRLVNEILS